MNIKCRLLTHSFVWMRALDRKFFDQLVIVGLQLNGDSFVRCGQCMN